MLMKLLHSLGNLSWNAQFLHTWSTYFDWMYIGRNSDLSCNTCSRWHLLCIVQNSLFCIFGTILPLFPPRLLAVGARFWKPTLFGGFYDPSLIHFSSTPPWFMDFPLTVSSRDLANWMVASKVVANCIVGLKSVGSPLANHFTLESSVGTM